MRSDADFFCSLAHRLQKLYAGSKKERDKGSRDRLTHVKEELDENKDREKQLTKQWEAEKKQVQAAVSGGAGTNQR